MPAAPNPEVGCTLHSGVLGAQGPGVLSVCPIGEVGPGGPPIAPAHGRITRQHPTTARGQARSERGLVRRPAQTLRQGPACAGPVGCSMTCSPGRGGGSGTMARCGVYQGMGRRRGRTMVRSRVVVAAMLVWSLLALGSCTDRGASARGPGPRRSASVSNDAGAQPSGNATVLAELGRRAL